MPPHEILILAMTKMLSGICVAGFSLDPDPITKLRWVRPVREFDTLQPGDMTYADGHLVQCSDVVELHLLKPRPATPHVEDWLADLVRHRPKLVRRLEGDKRAQFFLRYLDPFPEDVLAHHTRSLCLAQPEQIWARFSLDDYSGKYEARLGFVLKRHSDAEQPTDVLWDTDPRGIPVTDLKWRALGRTWVRERGSPLSLDQEALYERLQAKAIYLTLGLSRNWQGECWPLAVGVHTIPDYEATVDLACL